MGTRTQELEREFKINAKSNNGLVEKALDYGPHGLDLEEIERLAKYIEDQRVIYSKLEEAILLKENFDSTFIESELERLEWIENIG